MALTYVAIAKIETANNTTATVTFSSIPQTYTDLIIFMSARTDLNTSQRYANIQIKPNGSGADGSDRNLFTIDGATVGSGSDGVLIAGEAANDSLTASVFGNSYVYIPNYTSSNNKSTSMDGVNENNATAAAVVMFAGLWSNSAAITSIDITPQAGSGTNFKQYSTFYLYGVKNTV